VLQTDELAVQVDLKPVIESVEDWSQTERLLTMDGDSQTSALEDGVGGRGRDAQVQTTAVSQQAGTHPLFSDPFNFFYVILLLYLHISFYYLLQIFV
jgi:hypothetical protein